MACLRQFVGHCVVHLVYALQACHCNLQADEKILRQLSSDVSAMLRSLSLSLSITPLRRLLASESSHLIVLQTSYLLFWSNLFLMT